MQMSSPSLADDQKQTLAVLSEERTRRHLYHLALANGLGGEGKRIVDSICHASSGAWQVSKRSDGSGINGGGPLEISVRSDSPGTLRYASCVGLPELSPMHRLQLGIDAFESCLNCYIAGVEQAQDFITPLKLWRQQLDAARGRFGCYLGGCHAPAGSRVKLYIDLFSSGNARLGLHHAQRLMAMYGQDEEREGALFSSASMDVMEQLFEIAIPRMLSMEWSTQKKNFSFKLYWRFLNGRVSPERVCNMLSADPQFGMDVSDAFRISSGGFYSDRMPTAGFVHAWPWAAQGAVGFYSMAPSRWARTPKKKEAIMALWQAWGGDQKTLDRTWKLAKGRAHQTTQVPTLTLLGLAEKPGGERTVSAYFNPIW